MLYVNHILKDLVKPKGITCFLENSKLHCFHNKVTEDSYV